MYHSIYSNLYYSNVHSKIFVVGSQLAIVVIRDPKLALESFGSGISRGLVTSKNSRKVAWCAGIVGELVLGIGRVGVVCLAVVGGMGCVVWLSSMSIQHSGRTGPLPVLPTALTAIL